MKKKSQFCKALQNKPGQTGFDSGQKAYVSMQCVVSAHYNLSFQKFNWRKQLRSRCLIEA